MCFSVKRIEKGVQIADNTHDVIFHMDILHIYIYIYIYDRECSENNRNPHGGVLAPLS